MANREGRRESHDFADEGVHFGVVQPLTHLTVHLLVGRVEVQNDGAVDDSSNVAVEINERRIHDLIIHRPD
jgi:hypothetical protein